MKEPTAAATGSMDLDNADPAFRKLLDAGEVTEAEAYLDRQVTATDRERIIVMIRRAECRSLGGHYADAKQMLEQAREGTEASESRDLRPWVLRGLATVALREGRLLDSENHAKDGIVEARRGAEDARIILAWLSLNIALVQRRLGGLTVAVRLLRKVLADARQCGHELLKTRSAQALALSLIHMGEFDQAEELLERLERETQGRTSQRANLLLVKALLAQLRGDGEACDKALGQAEEFVVDLRAFRSRIILMEYRADWDLTWGDVARAKTNLLRAFGEAKQRSSTGDLVAEIAGRLARVSLKQGLLDEALGYAEIAVNEGARADRLEEAAGWRILAECRLALDQPREAEEALLREEAVLSTTEFNVERKLWEAVQRRAGLGDSRAASSRDGLENADAYAQSVDEDLEAAYDQLRATFPPLVGPIVRSKFTGASGERVATG